MDNQNLSTFTPVYNYIPEKWEESRAALTQLLRQISNGVNIRDVGFYYTEETLTGQRFVPTDNQQNYRSVFRKVIRIGALPGASPKSVAHGITVSANTRFTSIYGTANNPSTSFIPLPYVSAASSAACIQVDVTATHVVITTGTNYSAYTDAFVVLEYVNEA